MTKSLEIKYTNLLDELDPLKNTEDNDIHFTQLVKSKWDEAANKPDVFRYKVKNLKEKVLDDRYLLQLNPDRGNNRRTPEQIDNIIQPFDINKFNFTKVPDKEVLFNLVNEKDGDIHSLIVNVSPISQYHTLLCPSVNKCLNQVVTRDSLELALQVMFLSDDRNLKIAFNSLCAFSSVNHLHYHLLYEKFCLPVQSCKLHHIKGPLHKIDDKYIAPAFCFEIPSKEDIKSISLEAYKVIEHLIKRSIAHNVLIAKSNNPSETDNEAVRLIILPRKNSTGVKQFNAFNVAVFELCGWFPVYDENDFNNLKVEDLDEELRKWKYNEFDSLSKEVMKLF